MRSPGLGRRRLIPQRGRVFLGCEGESERGYGARLRELLEEIRQDRHLEIVLLRPGGGDPLALVELALRRIAVDQRNRRTGYMVRAVLLDRDRWGQTPARDAQTEAKATAAGLRLIWQRPCHEALLLRHLAGCRDLQPLTSALALAELERRWPGYVKGSSAMQLAGRIDATAVRQAVAVEPELADFLAAIGFE